MNKEYLNQRSEVIHMGDKKEIPTINEDELVGYIMRKTSDECNLYYDDVRSVLDAEIEFLKEKDIVEVSND